ncbi:hypothetical protein [Hydrogenophaga sp.]|uniref:hypothetical protein n=1 Tax=Hydrogenophaga sp. TaxID=1904254 RepID=UPI0025C2E4D9|nr:hypothetical protein [Hydrogenophaga sp.]MBT9462993.1 hypothetical protein [Hydrogenophaga sp.]
MLALLEGSAHFRALFEQLLTGLNHFNFMLLLGLEPLVSQLAAVALFARQLLLRPSPLVLAFQFKVPSQFPDGQGIDAPSRGCAYCFLH